MNTLVKTLMIGLLCCSAQCEEVVLFPPARGKLQPEWAVPKERFCAPENDWNPDSGKFPVDINRYCIIARSNVMARHKFRSLPEVGLINIHPIKAKADPNDPSSPFLRRTVISFHFREAGTGPKLGPVEPVIMLLDGTIATMKRPQGEDKE